MSDPYENGGVDYARGLGEAVSVALDYGLATFEGDTQAPVPGALVDQARSAARHGVSLDTVLRRYLAGYTLLCDQLLLEAEQTGLPRDRDLRCALQAQGVQLDRLLATVTDAHTTEIAALQSSADYRLMQLMRRLLEGELIDPAELNYPLDGWHLGVVAGGPSAPNAVRQLARQLDRRLLLAHPGGETVWAWLGGRHPILEKDLEAVCLRELEGGTGVRMAAGRSAEGVDGVRTTHRQAKAAFPLAARAKRVVRYADVAVVASAWRDEVLSQSLSQMFLAPLASERDGGATLLKTLQAYFATGRNAASAASRLQISRQTVNNRLRAIEDKTGRSIDMYGSEAETALRLWELGHPTALAVWSNCDKG